MKPGQVYRTFTAKDGTPVTLRVPRWEDLDDFLTFINGLVEEGADIIRDQLCTRVEEAKWLGRYLADVETGRTIGMVAEVDGHVIANAEVTKMKGCSSHVGSVGIGISKAYRDLGIGTAMLETLIAEAQTSGLQVLSIGAFATNQRALHVYEKVGFTRTGVRPKMFFRDGQYIDDVIMSMEL
jgi:RimJ/RimL family protein N-acetyltransferase